MARRNYRLSSKGQEPPEVWVERWRAFLDRVWNADGRADERRKFRDARKGKFPNVVVGASKDRDASVRIRQQEWNLVERVCTRSQGACFDDEPLLTVPRDKPGRNQLADGVERALSRMTQAGGLPVLCRRGVPKAYTDGSFVIYTGLPFMPTRREVQVAAEGAGAAVAAGQEGVPPEPVPGQDHKTVVEAIGAIQSDPEEAAAMTPEQQLALAATAGAHAEAAEEEEDEPIEWNHERGRLYWELLTVGKDVAWDATVSDFDQKRWVGRALVLRPEEAAVHPAFRPSWRKKLRPRRIDVGQTAVDAAVEKESPTRTGVDLKDAERVVVLEIWDRLYDAHHYVAEGMDEYGEKDDEFPYVGRDGRSRPPGYFPFVQFAPWLEEDEEDAASSLGRPGFRIGWSQQIKVILLDSWQMNAIRRAATNKYAVNAQVSDAAKAALRSDLPDEVVPLPRDMKASDAMQPFTFVPPLAEIGSEKQRAVVELCTAYEYPISELTSEPQAETLGQDELAVAAGRRGLGTFVKYMEGQYARVVDYAWWLVRECLPPEDVVAWMGPEFADLHDQWQSSPVNDEQIRVKFGESNREDDPKKVDRLMTVHGAATAQVGPLGLPKYDTEPLLQEACKRLGVGELAPYEPSPEDLKAAAIANLATQLKGSARGGRGGGGRPPAGGPPGAPKAAPQAEPQPA